MTLIDSFTSAEIDLANKIAPKANIIKTPGDPEKSSLDLVPPRLEIMNLPSLHSATALAGGLKGLSAYIGHLRTWRDFFDIYDADQVLRAKLLSRMQELWSTWAWS